MTESEKRVKHIWTEVFGRNDIKITDNFFEYQIISDIAKKSTM